MIVGSETPITSIPPYYPTQNEREDAADDWMTDESLIHEHVEATAKFKHVLPYDRPLLPTIFSINVDHPHAKIRPFRQRIQLLGPNSYAVRATAQVDNG